MKTMDWLYRLCRWTLGVIFIYAVCTKLLVPKIRGFNRCIRYHPRGAAHASGDWVAASGGDSRNRCHDDAAASDCLPKNLKKASPKL